MQPILKFERKSFRKPDETRQFRGHGHLDVVHFDENTTMGRAVFEPGWRWSNDVKPIAGTETCQASHLGYCLSGSMTIRMVDGREMTLHAGDAFEIPPGHDAWVVGDQRCELIDFGGFRDYAKKQAA